ncbi:LysR family cys regulon transcriptional activator [Orbus hercynius]|uniref:LysR family cys regulon transcriptional activator n=1 Tax=Orbus hercynius TaxID=593135 RepID=A0A495RKD7_9GAMM|nr:LysR substrate-binding domain-containing protein [Orbus hercynius]RKS87819.1 LysR family cys regulon transcriptional activator [Orbus hercynius]
MNLQQLRIIREAARCNYNLTEVANVLYTSQSGVSRHIKELEDELNIEIFIRQGKRLINMTEPGFELVVIAERILNEINNIRRLSTVFANNDEGSLVIATTHCQARFILPNIIKLFKTLFPQVHISINQGSSSEIASMLLAGDADIVIDNARNNNASIVTFPFYRWHCDVILPTNHPLSGNSNLTLEELSGVPLITYCKGLFPRDSIDKAFTKSGLSANVTLNVQQSDVINTYVKLGLGVGIIIDRMFDAHDDENLMRLNGSALFESHTAWIGIKRHQLKRNYIWRFIQLCNQELTLEEIKTKALSSEEKSNLIDYQI